MKKIIAIVLGALLIFSCKTKNISSKSDSQKNLVATLEYKINSKLGEGAFWNYKTQELYWIDILGKKFHIYDPGSKTNTTYSTPSLIGTVVPKNNTEAIIALQDGIYSINLKSKEVKLVTAVKTQNKDNRFNDGKCDPSGNLWVGTVSKARNVSGPDGGLFKISPTGKSEKMLSNVAVSNGIVWTSDSKTMYYIDTITSNIKAYDFDVETNAISNERIVVVISEELGKLDGMAIDENGMLWVGMWNGNAVLCFDPNTGNVIRKVEVPAPKVTSCAFGGENLDTLYITTSSIGRNAEEKEKYPLAGSIFKVKPGVKGVKSNFFGN